MIDERQQKEAQIRYWQETTDHYLKFGTTIQAGLHCTAAQDNYSFDSSNDAILKRAGLRGGEVVLDAGCGVGGPSLYAASKFPDIEIHGITICAYQAEVAQRLIAERAVTDQVHIQVGDYHDLPFSDCTFDRVLFLESASYSYQLEQLFLEVARVLKPGGSLYVKDVFRRAGQFTAKQAQEWEDFCRIYVQHPQTIEHMVNVLNASGFSSIWALDITPSILTRPCEPLFDLPRFRDFTDLPYAWGEIFASRP